MSHGDHFCFECSLAAGAPVVAGIAQPGHAYECPKFAADPNDADAVAAAAAQCPAVVATGRTCCTDPRHHFNHLRTQ